MTLHDIELHQIDIKTIILNGDLDETIDIVQLENFKSRDPKHLVRIFKKSIYGLK